MDGGVELSKAVVDAPCCERGGRTRSRARQGQQVEDGPMLSTSALLQSGCSHALHATRTTRTVRRDAPMEAGHLQAEATVLGAQAAHGGWLAGALSYAGGVRAAAGVKVQ